MEEKSKSNLSFKETAFIMTNKHFDVIEKNVIINYSNIDNNFVDNFYNYYLRERPKLSHFLDEFIEKNLNHIKNTKKIYNPEKKELVENYINEIAITHKIKLINDDINQRLYNPEVKKMVSALKSKFQLDSKNNIDIISYKFIKLLENIETKNSLKGHVYIEFAKELSNILNNESAYLSYEEYCMDIFMHEELIRQRQELKNSINKKIKEKAAENVDKELFPNKSRIDYDEFSNKISKYIQGGTRDIYKYIIENKKFPNNPNLPPLRMISNKNADIVRFADAFEIPLRDISKIFGTLVVSKERSPNARTEFYFFLKAYCPNLYKEKNLI